jgi:hypothetical protein
MEARVGFRRPGTSVQLLATMDSSRLFGALSVDLVYLVICTNVFHESTQNMTLEAGAADGETEEFRG